MAPGATSTAVPVPSDDTSVLSGSIGEPFGSEIWIPTTPLSPLRSPHVHPTCTGVSTFTVGPCGYCCRPFAVAPVAAATSVSFKRPHASRPVTPPTTVLPVGGAVDDADGAGATAFDFELLHPTANATATNTT